MLLEIELKVLYRLLCLHEGIFAKSFFFVFCLAYSNQNYFCLWNECTIDLNFKSLIYTTENLNYFFYTSHSPSCAYCGECTLVQMQKSPQIACRHVFNISHIRIFLISSRTVWHDYIQASRQLVKIWVFVSCLMPIKAGGNLAVCKTQYLLMSVPWTFLLLKLLWCLMQYYFCQLLSLSTLCLLPHPAIVAGKVIV